MTEEKAIVIEKLEKLIKVGATVEAKDKKDEPTKAEEQELLQVTGLVNDKKTEEKPKVDLTVPVERFNSTIEEGETVYRTKTHGSFRMCRSAAWGRYLMTISDPDAKKIEACFKHGLHELTSEDLENLLEEVRNSGVELSDFERNGISLNKNFGKIPAELWSRWVALCFYMCPQTGSMMSSSFHDSQLEVQVCLLRNLEITDTGLTRAGSEWKMVIPKQVVSGTSVKAELNNCIDIETGEKHTQFPPVGWMHAGSSHSHNTMGAFFSGVDNKSELTCPGFHVVIGNINHKDKLYTYASSVVLRKMRKIIDLEELVDTDPVESEFHEDVLQYIDTVVSANKKLYEKKAEEQKAGSPLMFSQWSKDTEEEATLLPWELRGPPGSLAEAQARDRFLRKMNQDTAELLSDLEVDDIHDLEDLDLYFNDEDIDPNFPYHSEISSIVDNALSQGYKVADILLSLRKAKEEYDAFSDEVLKREW